MFVLSQKQGNRSMVCQRSETDPYQTKGLLGTFLQCSK